MVHKIWFKFQDAVTVKVKGKPFLKSSARKKITEVKHFEKDNITKTTNSLKVLPSSNPPISSF